MELTVTLLKAALIPALVAGAFLIPWQPWRKAEGNALKRAAAAFGVVAGFVVGWRVLEEFPEFPPVVADQWVLYVSILSLLALALPMMDRLDRGGRFLVRFAITGLTLATVWQPLVKNETWTKTEGALHFLGAGVLILAAWEALDRFAKERPGAAFPFSMWLLISGVALITVLDEALKYGVLFGTLAASQGAAIVVGLWGRRFQGHGVYAFVLLSTFFAMLVATQAWAYYDPTYDRFLLYFAAMIVAGGLEWIAPFARLSTWKREGLRTAAVLLFIGVALAISLSQQGAEDDYGYY